MSKKNPATPSLRSPSSPYSFLDRLPEFCIPSILSSAVLILHQNLDFGLSYLRSKLPCLDVEITGPFFDSKIPKLDPPATTQTVKHWVNIWSFDIPLIE